MELIFRESPSEGALRSVGDCPGIVGLVMDRRPTGARFAVSVFDNKQPSKRHAAIAADRSRTSEDGIGTSVEVERVSADHPAGVWFELDQAVAACCDLRSLTVLGLIVSGGLPKVAEDAVSSGRFEIVRDYAEFLIELRRLMRDRTAELLGEC